MKLDKDVIEGIIKKNVSDSTELTAILKALEQAEKDAEQERLANKASATKKKLLAVQIENTEDIYLVQAKEEFDDTTLIDILRHKLSSEFNASEKGSKTPVTCLSECFAYVAQKFWRDYDLAIKTREPLPIIKTKNHKIIIAPQDKD